MKKLYLLTFFVLVLATMSYAAVEITGATDPIGVNGIYQEIGTHNGEPSYTNGEYWLWWDSVDYMWVITDTKGSGDKLFKRNYVGDYGVVLPFDNTLLWQRVVSTTTRTLSNSRTYASGLTLGGHTWVVPEDYELLGDGNTAQIGSLLWWMNEERGFTQGTSTSNRNHGTWLNTNWGFTGFLDSFYWSNTYSNPPTNDRAWGVHLDAGDVFDLAGHGSGARAVGVSRNVEGWEVEKTGEYFEGTGTGTLNVEENIGFQNISGVNASFYCVDETNTCTPNIVYTTNITINDEGTFYLRYYSDDNAGNNETINSFGPIYIDYTAPTTFHNIYGDTYNTNYNPYVTVELIEFDNVSGVNTTQYCISNTTCTPNTTYTTNLTLHESGTHVVYYNSTDNAGNIQTTQNTTVTINSMFKDYATTETIDFPDIGDTIQLNVTLDSNVANNVNVSYCELFVDDGVYRSESNISVNSLITSDVILDYNFTVTTNTGPGNENVSWSVVCYDNEMRAFTSDEQEFEVKFTTPPTVEFNQSLTNFNITSGVSVLSKDLYNAEFSVDIDSILIDAIYADIYCPANGYIYNFELLDVNQQQYTLNGNVDLSPYELGLCTLEVTATTLSSSGTPIPTTNTAEFYIGSTIYVNSINQYSGEQIEDFNIIVENNDGYPPYNKIINNVNSTYTLENVSSGNYTIDFTSSENFNKTLNIEITDITNVIYQTGEAYLNVRFRNIQTLADLYNVSFVITDVEGNGGYTYEDSTLYQTLSTAADYTVVHTWNNFGTAPYIISNLTNQYRNAVNGYTAFVRYRFHYVDGSSALSPVLSTSSSAWQNGLVTNPHPNRAVDRIDLEMRTSSGISGRYAQTQNHVFNLVRGYYSGDNITTSLFINNGTYEISWDAPGFLPNSREFSIEYLENKTLILDTSFVGTFNLINERTLEPFDMTKPDRVEFQLFCNDKTTVSQVLPTTSSSFTLNITCDYDYFRFQVVYPDTSYYRSFIIDPDDLFNLDIYLIDSLEDRAVYNTMLTDDLLSRYENIRVFVYKSIGDERVQITASYIDIENKVGVFLLENNLYTVEIHSDNLPVLVLGDYSADSAGAKNIQLYDIGTFDPTIDSIEQVTYVVDTHTNAQNETFAVFRYNDNQNKTESVTFNVYEGRGSTVPVRTITTVMQNGLINVNITGIYDSNTTLYAEVLASRPTAQFDNNINYRSIIREDNTIRLEILEFFSTQAVSWFFMILLGMIAIMATIQTANWVSIALIALGFLFAAFAWLPLALGVLAFSAIISIVSILKEGEKLS